MVDVSNHQKYNFVHIAFPLATNNVFKKIFVERTLRFIKITPPFLKPTKMFVELRKCIAE